MKKSPLYFHSYMATFCQIISEKTDCSDLVIVDIVDSEGTLLNTPYLVAKGHLNNISGYPISIKTNRVIQTERLPDAHVAYCGKHPLNDEIVIGYCEETNAVYLSNECEFMSNELVGALCKSSKFHSD